jgi:hypothetical protein
MLVVFPPGREAYFLRDRARSRLGIIGLGLPVYAFYARRLPPARPEDWFDT